MSDFQGLGRDLPGVVEVRCEYRVGFTVRFERRFRRVDEQVMAGAKIDSVIVAGYLNSIVSSLAERRVVLIYPYGFDSELTCPVFDQDLRSSFERV